jgi:hypothetical protein
MHRYCPDSDIARTRLNYCRKPAPHVEFRKPADQQHVEHLLFGGNQCQPAHRPAIQYGKYQLETGLSAPFVTENQNSTEIVFAIPFEENLAGGFISWHASLKNKVNMLATPPISGFHGFRLSIKSSFFDLKRILKCS